MPWLGAERVVARTRTGVATGTRRAGTGPCPGSGRTGCCRDAADPGGGPDAGTPGRRRSAGRRHAWTAPGQEPTPQARPGAGAAREPEPSVPGRRVRRAAGGRRSGLAGGRCCRSSRRGAAGAAAAGAAGAGADGAGAAGWGGAGTAPCGAAFGAPASCRRRRSLRRPGRSRRSLRTTGGSMVDDADRTNSPISSSCGHVSCSRPRALWRARRPGPWPHLSCSWSGPDRAGPSLVLGLLIAGYSSGAHRGSDPLAARFDRLD